ncbi:hypothetical protein PBY51_008136 [Eleginops maclovinus]|uniref:Uncharacterized protein n=1 Tax=Eleginops maclovinus TaxID=56733 RepID=A0AAN7XAF4_ELEMC|nr:hypothetical protein PBY51_008136 [Eleginops maclovinus]
MVLCWPPVREQREGRPLQVYLSLFTGLARHSGNLATPPEPSLNVAENVFERITFYFAETRSAFSGT